MHIVSCIDTYSIFLITYHPMQSIYMCFIYMFCFFFPFPFLLFFLHCLVCCFCVFCFFIKLIRCFAFFICVRRSNSSLWILSIAPFLVFVDVFWLLCRVFLLFFSLGFLVCLVFVCCCFCESMSSVYNLDQILPHFFVLLTIMLMIDSCRG